MIPTEFWLLVPGPASYTLDGRRYQSGRRYRAESAREVARIKAEGVFTWIEKIPAALQPVDPPAQDPVGTTETPRDEAAPDDLDREIAANQDLLPPAPDPAPADPQPAVPTKKSVPPRRAAKQTKAE